MDLLGLLRTRISDLPNGAHSAGLQSVLKHIEAAYRHLSRAQEEQDDSAFTDAIYRTNQAFEGSIKEAYRVLTGKNPQQKRPYDIEKYLEEKKVFRDRVLTLFTNYRTDWRNPSTHDYSIDFDEDEAFLAIVSVSAFTKLLVDQIAERLAFDAVKRDAPMHSEVVQFGRDVTESLIDRVVKMFLDFSRHYAETNPSLPIESEAQLMGALSGFASSVAPDLSTTTGRIFRTDERPYYTDMTISEGNSLVVIELKRGQNLTLLESGLAQLNSYMDAAKTDQGILFLYSGRSTEYLEEVREFAGGTIRVIRPK